MKKIYENSTILVEVNASGEVFITNQTNTLAQLRVGTYRRQELVVTAHDTSLIPWSINGLSAFITRS